MIFDNLALYPNKSGYQNIASSLMIQGEDPKVIREKVTQIAGTLQVAHVLDRLPKTMSGGEKQRIALGRAPHPHPEHLSAGRTSLQPGRQTPGGASGRAAPPAERPRPHLSHGHPGLQRGPGHRGPDHHAAPRQGHPGGQTPGAVRQPGGPRGGHVRGLAPHQPAARALRERG